MSGSRKADCLQPGTVCAACLRPVEQCPDSAGCPGAPPRGSPGRPRLDPALPPVRDEQVLGVRVSRACRERLVGLAAQLDVSQREVIERGIDSLGAELDAWLARADAVNWDDYADLVLCERMVAAALRDLDVPKELEQFVEQALDTRLREWAEGRA